MEETRAVSALYLSPDFDNNETQSECVNKERKLRHFDANKSSDEIHKRKYIKMLFACNVERRV